MEVSLNPELEKLVLELVETGRFASVSELFEASLTKMMTMDSDFDGPEEIAALEESERQLAAGETITLEELRRQFQGK